MAELESTITIQSYGFHETQYGFENSTLYKNKLAEVRDQQKQLIKDKTATHHNPEKEFILDTIKLVLRTFNSECENIITKVKHSNLEASEKRIHKVFDEINALTTMQQVSLSKEYLNLKVTELHLKHEYEAKKQQEKEEQAILKERLKEETKTLKELVHTKQAILHKEQNVTAGYVYIISNVGSLGEDVYKIGMTRKLDPEEIIKEFGNASVPFNFDIHALIFSEDAIALEKQLHEKFRKNQIS
ncbi:MAG: DUF4041 domain-containing protein [Zhenhengia sp.]|uniref:DUF4041 domain-containing protein n=1 Tax=Zhenhengia sp. TaxID=2944208 RepID=UPI00290E6239|nr:DUF4041 domain-containing protein [Clostridiales bacterium]MDU6974513.1 DUF4041 domain-containing protein [Clostridiales bacterium]